MTTDLVTTGIVSVAPTVTFTKRHIPTPLGIAGSCPELFEGRRSLHLVSPCWSLYPDDIEDIAAEWRRTTARLPDALVVFVASTDHDAYRLSSAGVPAIVGNSTILTDERAFRPLNDFDFSNAQYDAIYNARFEPYKRHELAKSIDKLALLYDAAFDGESATAEEAVRRALPRARFINHEYGRGRHVPLEKAVISRELNKARCGLCLSADEGAMRASLEYLLCGLPVVTTESRGGRDRYYEDPYTLYAKDDPEAIADAVIEMEKRNLNKLAIREHIGRIVAFERRNFLTTINAIASEHFDVAELFPSIEPFLDVSPFIDPSRDWSRVRLEEAARALGRRLAPKMNAPAAPAEA